MFVLKQILALCVIAEYGTRSGLMHEVVLLHSGLLATVSRKDAKHNIQAAVATHLICCWTVNDDCYVSVCENLISI